jgi:phosphoribosylanthranilate isomerase
MVEVKICGLSTRESVDAAIAAGADYVGLVFFPKSPRNVSLEQARDLAAHAKGRVKVVALVVDADDARLKEITDRVSPEERRRRFPP